MDETGRVQSPREMLNVSSIQRTTIYKKLKIMFVESGFNHMAPYQLISNGISESLSSLVMEFYKVNPTDNVSQKAFSIKPDLVLVLLGDNFPISELKELKKMGIKTAVWLTDDPYYVDKTIQYVPHYDYVFTNELSTISLYHSLGCKDVNYLPLAVNTSVFKPQEVIDYYKSDICFVATAWDNRIQFIDSIASFLKYKNVKIIGPNWNKLRNYRFLANKILPTGVSMEETAKFFSGAKIVINMHRSHNDKTLFSNNSKGLDAYSLNPRTFEICASKTFQLIDYRLDLPNFYKQGIELEMFNSTNDFIQKVNYYLEHEDARQQIANNGFNTTLSKHTFYNRLKDLLEIVFPDNNVKGWWNNA